MNKVLCLAFLLNVFLIDRALGVPKVDEVFVTITEEDYLKMFGCFAKSADLTVYRKYEACEAIKAPQTLAALRKCEAEIVPKSRKSCDFYAYQAENPEVPKKIYDCVRSNIGKYTPEDKQKMTNFEVCIKKLYRETCPQPRAY